MAILDGIVRGVLCLLLLLALVLLCLAVGMLFGGCHPVQEGPPIELAPLVTPDVVKEPPPAPSSTPPPPPLERVPGRGFKVWIPRSVTRHGDVHEGHFVDVSDKAPQKELIKPDYDVPKTPKQVYRPAAKPAASGTVPRSSQAPPPAPAVPLPLPPPLQEAPHDLPQP